jgi:uncharacterized protein YceK
MNWMSGTHTRSRQRLIWTAFVAICALLLLSGAASVAAFEFGSLKKALMYLNGHMFVVDQPQWDGDGSSDSGNRQMRFTITNLAGTELVVSGARSSCGCVQALSLPLSVPSHTSKSIVLRHNTPATRRTETVDFYADIENVRHSFRVAIPFE